jgi:hypothetical protein
LPAFKKRKLENSELRLPRCRTRVIRELMSAYLCASLLRQPLCLARRDGADLGVAQRLFSLELLGRERLAAFFSRFAR